MGTIITNQAFWSTIDYKEKIVESFTFIDITEKKEKEHKLRLQEHKQQALINNTKDQIWSLDRSFRLLSFNQSVSQSEPFACLVFTCKLATCTFQDGKSLVSIHMWKSLFQKAFEGDSFSTEIGSSFP
jgi:hypothetical protein